MEQIQRVIEQLVEDAYKDHGFVGKASSVEVREGRIIITINSEKPFMGLAFWRFLDTLKKKLRELGYKWKDRTFDAAYYSEEYVK